MARPILAGKQRHLGYFAEKAEATEAVAAARAADGEGRLEAHLQGIKKKLLATKVWMQLTRGPRSSQILDDSVRIDQFLFKVMF